MGSFSKDTGLFSFNYGGFRIVACGKAVYSHLDDNGTETSEGNPDMRRRLPVLLVFSALGLHSLPSLDPMLNAGIVGLFMLYVAIVTVFFILPGLSDPEDAQWPRSQQMEA